MSDGRARLRGGGCLTVILILAGLILLLPAICSVVTTRIHHRPRLQDTVPGESRDRGMPGSVHEAIAPRP
jgi:hypothetical protein